jgi:hypothetical protein
VSPFYEDAMQACIRAGVWDEVDRYAQELENYTASEPIPRCKLFVDRGRALAAFGRDNRGQGIIKELQRVHEETARVKLKFALPELEAALQSV